ncbi:MAG: hypothetical protein ABIA76_06370 [Candidatus Diapherotrites archaeon]
MALMLKFRNALKSFAVKVLDVDDTSLPQDHLDILNDFRKKFNFNYIPKDLDEFLDLLKKKHLVDSISVSNLNGKLITSTNGNGLSESLTGSALFNFIKSELPQSEVLLIKEKNWFMIFYLHQKIYVVRSPANLSMMELKVLASELEEFLEKNKSGAN